MMKKKYKTSFQGIARAETVRALHKGMIEKGDKCFLCFKSSEDGIEIEGHHEDYLHPYEIMWLCRSCHRKYHYLKRRYKDGGQKVPIADARRYVSASAKNCQKGDEIGQRLNSLCHREFYLPTPVENALNDKELWKAFKVRCIQRGVKIRATLAELIREHLKKTEK